MSQILVRRIVVGHRFPERRLVLRVLGGLAPTWWQRIGGDLWRVARAAVMATAACPEVWWSAWTGPGEIVFVGGRKDDVLGTLDLVFAPAFDDPAVRAVAPGEHPPVYHLSREEHEALEATA